MTTDESHPFSSFGLSDAVLEALTRKGFTSPSSIQTIALPRLLADSGHVIVKARTGTGKTAAFGIPLVERITTRGHAPRALILTPTRELALQVSREIASLCPGAAGSGFAGSGFPGGPGAAGGPGPNQSPRITAVYGGASIRTQIFDLKRGTEVVVGTPGRIMDLMERKVLDLSAVDWFILDEADEMLDMGFFEDVEKIMSAIKPDRRVALFSATMPDAILKVIRQHIGEVEILVDTAPDDEKPAVDQFYMILKREDRLEVLRRIIDGAEDFYGLIFCATKIETDELARRLVEASFSAEAIHGDLSQEARERTLRRFRAKLTTILVATDVAARGLDIERLTHVINWDLPNDSETYVHRIGRTGRAGRRGRAISFALPADRGRISHISRTMERTLGSKILWMKVPAVKSVMKAIRSRIVASVVGSLPDEEIPAPDVAIVPPSIPFAEGVPTEEVLAADETANIPAAVIETPALEKKPAVKYAADSDAAAGGMDTAVGGRDGSDTASADAVSPFLAKVCRQLIERLGSERAVEALVSLSYGELLDPSRYGTVTEFSEESFRDSGRGRDDTRGRFGRSQSWGRGDSRHDAGHVSAHSIGKRLEGAHGGTRPDRPGFHRGEERSERSGFRQSARGSGAYGGGPHAGPGPHGGLHGSAGGPGRGGFAGDSDGARVYVGLGRHHGASARDVAELLIKAGAVPGRLVDAIEMKEFCAFATLPEEAARRACSFSRSAPGNPVIRPASPDRD
jgi:ATP-dependent RNA helicase DeaD